MPQIFQALKCYKCAIFQVHLTKKSPKWECKMCGEKQSIKRHYGIGTAQECRGHVQKLNTMQGGKSECSSMIDMDSEEDYTQSSKEERKHDHPQTASKRVSKWSAFIEDSENILSVTTDPEIYEDAEVVLELPRNKKRKILCKEIAKSGDIIKAKNSNHTTCYQKPESKKQCNEQLTKRYKWFAYTLDNDNMPVNNESIHCNKNDISSQITNQKRTRTNEKELGIDINQYNENSVTDLNTNQLAGNENIAHELCYTRNVHRNYTNDDPMILERNKSDSKGKGSKWTQFLESDDPSDLKCDDDKSQCQMENKSLFSMCDDEELDSILDL